jgi:phosphatidylglycerophosphatase A
MIPKAPGTFGTLWGLPLTWAILQLPMIACQVGTVVVLCALGVPICGAAARRLGRKDPGSVVWDEFVALPIVFLGRTPVELHSRPSLLLTGFVLFRMFDISKLPPGRQLERLPGGWGIMADDIAAAAYSWIVLNILIWLLPSL